MKTIVIGDVHGRNDWKAILYNAENYDKMVFIGDYFDSFDLDVKTQMDNFKEIVAYKRKYPDKVVLLYGNHDLHYLLEDEQYSGYQKKYAFMIKMLLEDAKDVLQWAYKEGHYLFTHAGVTKTWCKSHDIDMDNLVESINQTPFSSFGFQRGGKSNSGDDIHQGPCWVRPGSLWEDRISGYIQVVGHTQDTEIVMKQHVEGPIQIQVDAPDSNEYLSIEDGKAIIKTYKSN